MTKIRSPRPKGKYYLPKQMFLTAVHYAQQYPIWLNALNYDYDARQGLAYDKDRVQTSGTSDSTSTLGIQRAEASRKIDFVEGVAETVAGHHFRWLILGCCYCKPYYELQQDGIPYGKDLYYKLRRRFFYELAHKI